jgi:ABC-type sugar transport system ATPase subunit
VAMKDAKAIPEPGVPRVELRGIVKSYPGVRALRGVDLVARAGEVHALCGENGAGKSTLIEVLGGAVRPDEGQVLLDGEPSRFRDPADALARGVAVIHQEFSLVGTLTVAENLALGDEPRRGPWIDRRALRARGVERLRALGFDVPPDARAGDLTTGQRQLVEIARALGRRARVLVLDEPTAALSRAEAGRLSKVLADLKSRGLAILYISHHLDEVARIADRITVLRDGSRVGTWEAAELTTEQLVAAMTGGESGTEDRAPAPTRDFRAPDSRPPILEVRGAAGRALRGVDLAVRAGEVVGLIGRAGAGHEELARIIFGADRLRAGSMFWQGQPYRPSHPADAIPVGIASVPADRRREGLVPTMGVEANVTLATLPRQARLGCLDRRLRRRRAVELCRAFDVVHAGPDQRATTLSGGNQQKVLLARWAAVEPRLLILNDPTRGIDVRARAAIHRRIGELARSGLAILLVTADAHELLLLADRVVVLRAGRVALDRPAGDLGEPALRAAMADGG